MAVTGIGIDIAQINRFEQWLEHDDQQLKKLFNDGELLELRAAADEEGLHAAHRFIASRFAAKEAFYKAFSATLVELNHVAHPFSFFQACKHVSIVKGRLGVPACVVDWHHFENLIHAQLPHLHAMLSISHEKEYAVAQVVIQKS